MARKLAMMGLRVEHRAEMSPDVQRVLSDFGEQILMRSGVPSPDRKNGLIGLMLEAEEGQLQELAQKLGQVKGVTVRTVSF